MNFKNIFSQIRPGILLLFISPLMLNVLVAAGKDDIQLSPAGQKIVDEKIASYPAFDLKTFTKEAEQKYPLLKKGDEVKLSYRNKQAEGKFYEVTDKYVRIGTQKVYIIDLTQDQMAQFSPEVNSKMRQLYVDRQRSGYNAKRMLFEQDLVKPLLQQYPPVSRSTFAKVFMKLKDQKLAEKYTDEILALYDSSLPIPEDVSKRQFLRKTLDDFLAKHQDVVLEGVYVISIAEKQRQEEELRKREEARQKKLAERITCPRAATPVFSPDGGEYNADKAVAITCPTEGAEIRYTVNNESPTEESPLYTEPVKLKMNQRLKAIAFHSEYNDSDCAYMATWDGRGLYAAYFNKTTFTGDTVIKLDKQVFFDWAKDKLPEGVSNDFYSALWTGHMIPPESGEYTIYLQGDDAIRMWINGKVFIDGWVEQSRTEYKESANLVAGKKYDIKLALVELGGTSSIMLEWSKDGMSRQAVPSNCLYPTGTETDKLRLWNKKQGNAYVNRKKMTNPGSNNGQVLLNKYHNKNWQIKSIEQFRAGD